MRFSLDFSEMDETPTPPTISSNIQRLNSYASSSSSSGVVMASKSLSQNLSCDSSRSNFSTFESLDLNLSDCSDLASSLPSCASGNVHDGENKEDGIIDDVIKISDFLIELCKFSSLLPPCNININHSQCLRVSLGKITVLVLAK